MPTASPTALVDLPLECYCAFDQMSQRNDQLKCQKLNRAGTRISVRDRPSCDTDQIEQCCTLPCRGESEFCDSLTTSSPTSFEVNLTDEKTIYGDIGILYYKIYEPSYRSKIDQYNYNYLHLFRHDLLYL